jgi:deoxyribodipyrimidine photo-lyase
MTVITSRRTTAARFTIALPTDVAGMRIRHANDRAVRPAGAYVLYWMIAARRPWWNFALDRAVDYARALAKPLLIFEALECDYPWASDRLHRFIIGGMRANAQVFRDTPSTYVPYVEPRPGAARGLLAALAQRACVVITDEFPCFFLPAIVAAAAGRVDAHVEVVDGNGLMPLAAADRPFSAASGFRRFVQHGLLQQLRIEPRAEPFRNVRLPVLRARPDVMTDDWAPAATALLRGDNEALAGLPIDHTVPVVAMPGGAQAAAAALDRFIAERLAHYADVHGEPEVDGTSRLSPYLHFGHVSAHQVFAAVMRHERWSPRKIAGQPARRAREGWWHASAGAERFLDQLVVWRELAYNTCATRPRDYDRFESLPEWARATLRAHQRDRRPHVYDRDTFESAATHDALWNASQGQMRQKGWVHNYLRMLWGKKILEWSRTPQDALQSMIAIMNRWSLDGRNPNSYAGYAWTLGRYDRPWPERPVYGTIRSMSSERTAKKIHIDRYIATFAPRGAVARA